MVLHAGVLRNRIQRSASRLLHATGYLPMASRTEATLIEIADVIRQRSLIK